MEKNSLFESAFDRWVFAAQGRQGGAGGAVYAKDILELNNGRKKGCTNVHYCIIILNTVLMHYTILQEPRRPDPVSAVAPFLQIILSFRIIPVFIAITFIITVAFCQV